MAEAKLKVYWTAFETEHGSIATWTDLADSSDSFIEQTIEREKNHDGIRRFIEIQEEGEHGWPSAPNMKIPTRRYNFYLRGLKTRKSFSAWLHFQRKRNDATGDIARDWEEDSLKPKYCSNLKKILKYLRNREDEFGGIHCASDEAINAMKNAWKEYCNQFGFEFTDPDEDIEQLEEQEVEREIINGNLRLRFLVFKRDGYRCQICGRTAQDGVKLELGHKIAKAKGGAFSEDNLHVLCFDCNRGQYTDEL